MSPSRDAAESHISVRSPTLSDQIADALIKRIVRGDYPPGEAMPSEEELASEFDVSRPVIREAVKQLAVIGLVQSRQGRSTRVAPERSWNHLNPRLLDARSEVGAVDVILLELLELRRLVEVGAAGLAAARRDDDDLAAMRAAVAGMKRAGDTDTFTEGDIAFHSAVLDATRNILLIRLVEQIEPLMRSARRMSLSRRLDRRAESLREHEALLEHIRAGEIEEARQAMRAHLSWTANLNLGEEGGEAATAG